MRIGDLDIKENDIDFILGESVLTEFIRDSKTEDIIEELIQNDFDAKSPKTVIKFLKDKLIIEGYGKPIEKEGWVRLKAMLGHGRLLGTDVEAKPKKSKLGIKNQGLRTLFRIGDHIIVRSKGLMTILSWRYGALKSPKEDKSFKRRKGIEIEVPYRQMETKDFKIFDENEEKRLYEFIIERLPLILIKLPTDLNSKVLERVEIIFERLGIKLICSLKVKRNNKIKNKKIKSFIRTINISGFPLKNTSDSTFKPFKKRYMEVEYFKTLIDDEYLDQNIPKYFCPSKKGNIQRYIRIGFSFEIDNKFNIKFYQPGRLFYPIGIQEEFTGNFININAPFILNNTRSAITNSKFNDWLIESSASLFIELLQKELLHTFGAKAYDLLLNSEEEDNEIFKSKIIESLKVNNCILNDLYKENEKITPRMFNNNIVHAPMYKKDSLNVKALDFYGLICRRNRTVSRYISDDFIRYMQINMKSRIKILTINNLVEIMANDEDRINNKETKGWHYSKSKTHRKRFSNVKTQIKFINLFNTYYDEIDNSTLNRLFLSKSLLPEKGPLSCWDRIFLFNGKVSDFIGFDKSNILHHKIVNLPLFKRSELKRIVRPYNINQEIEKKYLPLIDNEKFDEIEKRKLLKFIINNIDLISKSCINEIKKYRIFLDANNNWVKFYELIIPSKDVKKAFKGTLSFPHKLLLSETFTKKLQIRTKINKKDIKKQVKLINPENDKIKRSNVIYFEKFLSENMKFIKGELLKFLDEEMYSYDTKGQLIKIRMMYINDDEIKKTIGKENNHYIAGKHTALYKRIGINTKPLYEDIIKLIAFYRIQNIPLKNSKRIYMDLVDSIKRQKIKKEEYEDQLIINIGFKYDIPHNIILDSRYKYRLGDSKLYFDISDQKFKNALKFLGCKTNPSFDDYKYFILWASDQSYVIDSDKFINKYKKMLHNAYSRYEFRNLSNRYEDDENVILTESGVMLSPDDAKNGLVVFNDFQPLYNSIIENDVNLHFTDCGDESSYFIKNHDIQKISDIYPPIDYETIGILENEMGQEDRRLVRRIQSKKFIGAISSIIRHDYNKYLKDVREYWQDSLLSLSEIKYCEKIVARFDIRGEEVETDMMASILDNIIYLQNELKMDEKKILIAENIAKVIFNNKDQYLSFSDTIYIFLEGNIDLHLSLKGIKGKKPKHIPRKKRKEQSGFFDPKKLGGSSGPKGGRRGGGGGGYGGGGGGRRSSNHDPNYGEYRQWVLDDTNRYCQVCTLICDNCIREIPSESCDCDIRDFVCGVVETHHLEPFENHPERDRIGNIVIVCKYHHKTLNRTDMKVAYKNNEIIKEKSDGDYIITVHPHSLNGEALIMKLSEEHYKEFIKYMRK